jgi:hypothetical protein
MRAFYRWGLASRGLFNALLSWTHYGLLVQQAVLETSKLGHRRGAIQLSETAVEVLTGGRQLLAGQHWGH